jgi:iron-sulfur cluster repair protein YtfE (RIC family)
VKKALADHRKLTRLFTVPTQLERTLGLIEEKLENHIRFEERILFKEIKAIVSATVSEEIVVLHSQKPDTSFFKSWQDAFWI